MSFHRDTSTDYLDLLQEVLDVMTNSVVTVAAVNAPGTGYAVGDVLRINGGTTVNSKTAAVEVLTITGGGGTGPVGTVRIWRCGSYTATPGSGATTTAETGSGTSCTIDVTIATLGWTVVRRSQEAVSASITGGSGGTGYTPGDKLTLTMDGGGILGADDIGVAPIFTVATISGGGGTGPVATLTLDTAGNLEEVPDVDSVTGGDQANTSGGTGTGCILTVTYQDATTQDQVVILEGNPSGVSDLYVGIKTYQTADVTTFLTCRNWALFGMISFNPLLPFKDQAALSPGVASLTGSINSSTSNGAWLPLKGSDAYDMEYWLTVSERYVKCVVKTEDVSDANYQSFYMGYHNPAGTSTEMPYPICVFGATSRWNSYYTDQVIGRSTSLAHAYKITLLTADGPGFIRSPVDNQWHGVRNSTISGDTTTPNRAQSRDHVVYPVGIPQDNPPNTEDDLIANTSTDLQWSRMIAQSGNPGIITEQLEATPNTGDDLRILVPATILSSDENGTGTLDDIYEINGELDGVYWLPGVGVSDEDSFLVGADRYRIFPNGNQRQVFSYWAIKEA